MSEFGVRAIAFYLPQFHPIPENDAWWGPGFTEWTNAARARPRFPGHYQPHLPADLGFYDLRLPETRQAQADLARAHGLHGFCYYHYWFGGRRLLERPFNEVLASGKPDFPFCLCWANENWTRAWDGSERETLVEQRYSEADDLAHIRWALSAFADRRYIRVEDKPLFLVYRASRLPNPIRTAALWREEVRKAGFPGLYLCRVESFDVEHGDPRALGFDASVEFQPDWNFIPELLPKHVWWSLRRRLGWPVSYRTIRYKTIVRAALQRPPRPYEWFPCVTPGWDNTPRRRRDGLVLTGATPDLYRQWLEEVVARLHAREPGNRIVFINAWNEWGEGNHLEPCRRWGRAYLEATRQALEAGEAADSSARLSEKRGQVSRAEGLGHHTEL